jgi:hypothetical protein
MCIMHIYTPIDDGDCDMLIDWIACVKLVKLFISLNTGIGSIKLNVFFLSPKF